VPCHRRPELALIALALAVGLSGCAAKATKTDAPGARASVIPLPTELPETISHADAVRLFEGDDSRLFDVIERSVAAEDGGSVHDITYVGADGQRHQANLVIPAGRGPFGAAMYLHGAGGSSSDFVPEAIELARRGVASLLISQPEADALPMSSNAARNELVYEMREMDRALDLLASRPEVDPSRLGFAGFSFGAVRGATFSGFEGGRLRIAVLAALPPRYGNSGMAAFDPIAWVPYVSPARLYLQEGTGDTWFSHDEAEGLIAAAREPKLLVWYEAGHGLDDQACFDRLDWMARALGRG
jgi:predicted esterase